jgi:hypothetical protein
VTREGKPQDIPGIRKNTGLDKRVVDVQLQKAGRV